MSESRSTLHLVASYWFRVRTATTARDARLTLAERDALMVAMIRRGASVVVIEPLGTDGGTRRFVEVRR